MRACTISWKNQCSRNFGKFIKQSDPIRYAGMTHPTTRPTTQPKLPTDGNLCLMNVLHPLSSVKAVIGHWSCNRTHSGFFDLKHCYQRASADNISRKFGTRSGPTKSLKLINPDGFPDFFYHTFKSTCKNKGADGTVRALRVIPAFNKVGVLAALNII